MSKSSKHINPSYKKALPKSYSLHECLAQLDTNVQVLSYLISKSESPLALDKQLIDDVLSNAQIKKQSKRIAITGSPGVGKSTFLNAYGTFLKEQGERIAILPVDPTSHISHGSILGDKTRMSDLVGQESVFIKPMASALALGGVAPATGAAISLCEAAGYSYIFIETVGVGQSEYAVKDLVDLFILLIQPGGGDELQGIKRGIMELADILIVTKADGSLATAAKESLEAHKAALRLLISRIDGWAPKCFMHSYENPDYLKELHKGVERFFTHMETNGLLESLRRNQAVNLFKSGYKNIFAQKMMGDIEIKATIEQLQNNINNGTLTGYQALRRLEKNIDE